MKLQIGSQHTGMYGRRLVVFEPRKCIGPSVLPSNTFGPGETFCTKIYISYNNEASGQRGTSLFNSSIIYYYYLLSFVFCL